MLFKQYKNETYRNSILIFKICILGSKFARIKTIIEITDNCKLDRTKI